jgi:hypothetical protein
VLRFLALLGALAIPALALSAGAIPALAPIRDLEPAWAFPAAAALLILPYAIRAELAIAPVLAAALAAGAAQLGLAGGDALGFRDPPRFDITRAPIEPGSRGIAEVRGYLLRDVSIAEFQTDAPVADQKGEPDARLLLLLPVADGSTAAPESVVVVRLPRGQSPARRDGADVVTGRLSSAPRDLAATLLTGASLSLGSGGSVLLLDAGAVASVAESRRSVPLAGVLALGAAGLILFRRRADGESDEPSDAPARG